MSNIVSSSVQRGRPLCLETIDSNALNGNERAREDGEVDTLRLTTIKSHYESVKKLTRVQGSS